MKPGEKSGMEKSREGWPPRPQAKPEKKRSIYNQPFKEQWPAHWPVSVRESISAMQKALSGFRQVKRKGKMRRG